MEIVSSGGGVALRSMTPSALQTFQVVLKRGLHQMALSPRGTDIPSVDLKRGLLKHTLRNIQDAKRDGSSGYRTARARYSEEGRPRTADAAMLFMTPTKPMTLNEGYNPVPQSYWSPWTPAVDALQDVQASLSCDRCGKESAEIAEDLPDDSTVPPLLGGEACAHFLCPTCVRQHALDAQQQKLTQVACPAAGCPAELEVSTLQLVLEPEEFEAFLERALHAFLDADELVVKCPNEACSEVMSLVEVAAADVDVPDVITERDDAGRALSREAFVHFRRSRLRCRSCDTAFCARCKETPYHKGYTCEGWEERQAQRRCRFCDVSLTPDNTAPARLRLEAESDAEDREEAEAPEHTHHHADALECVCSDSSCLERRADACVRTLACGHACGGVRGELSCPPCAYLECALLGEETATGEEEGGGALTRQTADDYCAICYVEDLGAAPTCHLACGHVFHYHCLKQKLEARWPGKRITFGFMRCPLCAEHIRHTPTESPLAPLLNPLQELYSVVKSRALQHLKVDGLDKDSRVVSDTGGKYFGNPTLFAMDTYAFYPCSRCRQPFFGGRRECEQNMQADDVAEEELVCFDCSDLRVLSCADESHKEFVMWKCRYCCNGSVWFCFGTTHFCNDCHSLWIKAKITRKTGPEDVPQHAEGQACPLGFEHPPNATEEFSLGCAICGDERRSQLKDRQRLHTTLALEPGGGGDPSPRGADAAAAAAADAAQGEDGVVVRRDVALAAQMQLVRSKCCVVQ